MNDDNDFATDGLYHGDRAKGCEILAFFIMGFWVFICLLLLIIRICIMSYPMMNVEGL